MFFNSKEIISQIRMAGYTGRDMRTDSYVAWGIKQKLYEVKWAVDEAIRNCPNFSPEQEWLEEQEQYQIINILKK